MSVRTLRTAISLTASIPSASSRELSTTFAPSASTAQRTTALCDGRATDRLALGLGMSLRANQGDAVAQNNLGVMYRDGQGVALDYAQALIWFRKAADQGDAVAQNNLGGIYYEGQGVLQDFVRAHMWFNLAASRAEDAETREQATKNREILAAKMTPAQIAEAQRMAREWKPK